MDKKEAQEEKNQDKQQKSAIDRLNQGYNATQNARNALNLTKKITGKMRGSKNASIGARLASKGAQAVVRVIVSTSEVWVPIALIVGFFVLVIIIVIVIFSGVQPPPACKSLTTDKTTINKENPATLVLNECPEGVTYTWALPEIGGSFSSGNSQTTIYTPPELNRDQAVKIFVIVCAKGNSENCSQYSINLNISYASPSYPGITYSLKGPKDCNNPCRIKKGEPTNFNIEIKYDQDKALVPIENVFATASLSTAVFTVNSISGKTTAEFNPNLPLVKYLWRLSENQRSQDKDSKIKTFNFKLNLTPYINNTETSINLNIVGASLTN